MKHKEREWYTCDRCGAYIKNAPSSLPKIPLRRTKLLNLSTHTVSLANYMASLEPVLENVWSMDIDEYYRDKEKHYHLCGKCKKEFERWIKN